MKESGLGERSHSVRSNPNKVKLAEKRESSLEIDDDKKDIWAIFPFFWHKLHFFSGPGNLYSFPD